MNPILLKVTRYLLDIKIKEINKTLKKTKIYAKYEDLLRDKERIKVAKKLLK